MVPNVVPAGAMVSAKVFLTPTNAERTCRQAAAFCLLHFPLCLYCNDRKLLLLLPPPRPTSLQNTATPPQVCSAHCIRKGLGMTEIVLLHRRRPQPMAAESGL